MNRAQTYNAMSAEERLAFRERQRLRVVGQMKTYLRKLIAKKGPLTAYDSTELASQFMPRSQHHTDDSYDIAVWYDERAKEAMEALGIAKL